MLRVGLTGGLGSGKSTAAQLFAKRGAHVFNADEIGRELMQPGEAVFDQIVKRFGRDVVLPDGRLNRPAIARIVFNDESALADLNAIVHPATITRQTELIAAIPDPHAVAVVESALIFESPHGGPEGYRTRFDRIVLVTAPEAMRIARFVARMNPTPTAEQRAELEAEARRRLARQIPEEQKARLADYILRNDGSAARLEAQIDELWPRLQRAARANS
jgi:dephospho-CoA kinase